MVGENSRVLQDDSTKPSGKVSSEVRKARKPVSKQEKWSYAVGMGESSEA